MLRVVFVLRSTEVYPVLFRFVGRVLLLLLSSSISFPCLGFLRLGPRSRNPGAALLPGAAFHRLGPTKGNQPQQSDGEAVLTKRERERESRPYQTLSTCSHVGSDLVSSRPILKTQCFACAWEAHHGKGPGREGGTRTESGGAVGGWVGERLAG